jgi:hypothetical protein
MMFFVVICFDLSASPLLSSRKNLVLNANFRKNSNLTKSLERYRPDYLSHKGKKEDRLRLRGHPLSEWSGKGITYRQFGEIPTAYYPHLPLVSSKMGMPNVFAKYIELRRKFFYDYLI